MHGLKGVQKCTFRPGCVEDQAGGDGELQPGDVRQRPLLTACACGPARRPPRGREPALRRPGVLQGVPLPCGEAVQALPGWRASPRGLAVTLTVFYLFL